MTALQQSCMDSLRFSAQICVMGTEENPPTAVTVNTILDRFEREYVPHQLAPRTQNDYARHIVRLRKEFGAFVAADLKPKDFAPFINVIGKGRIHRVRTLAVLSAAFTQAVSSWFLIDHNVLRDVKRPKSKPRDRLVTDEEFGAVHRVASHRLGLAMELALFTGQRQGDILAFRWSDITDIPASERTPNGPTMELTVRQGKTGKRIGIGITPDLEKVLDRCWQLKNRNLYVIGRRDGERYTSEGFRAMFQRAMVRAFKRGLIKEKFHFHDLRALAATRCPTPEYAMRLLGHTTLAMTARVYRRGVERVKALQLT